MSKYLQKKLTASLEQEEMDLVPPVLEERDFPKAEAIYASEQTEYELGTARKQQPQIKNNRVVADLPQLGESSRIIEDFVMKNYLTTLQSMEVVPLPEVFKSLEQVRMFKLTEMIYQKEESSLHKLSSVFNSIQHLNCGMFLLIHSDGKKTELYAGVRSFDNSRTVSSLKESLEGAFKGQFPGMKTATVMDEEAELLLADISSKSIASVSCIGGSKDEEFKSNEEFVQGMEKFIQSMEGKAYTAIVLSKSVSSQELFLRRQDYEALYSELSPLAKIQSTYSKSEALSTSNAFSQTRTTSISESYAKSHGVSDTNGKNWSETEGDTESTSKSVSKDNLMGRLATVALAVGGAGAIIATGGAASPVVGAIAAAIAGAGASAATVAGVGATIAGVGGAAAVGGTIAGAGLGLGKKTTTNSTSWAHNTSKTSGGSSSHTDSYTDTETKTTGESNATGSTVTDGETTTSSDSLQLTKENKTIGNLLKRIDTQLERIEEGENSGMWETAAYFMADYQNIAEMAAGNYKALISGGKSGIETSSIQVWGQLQNDKLPILNDYLTNFIHPVFQYPTLSGTVPVTASTLISGNELALHMGLPQKSVPGFPVIEHMDFGKEVLPPTKAGGVEIGKIFNMGRELFQDVSLSTQSLTMHTFVTGSTGSGKSNFIYGMLDKIQKQDHHFLVIEPAKGEYKHVFGHRDDVTVLGTNPKHTELLRLNPFKFPEEGIHVLEHIDRLVEIFNVCWPMYAAMPAILKDGMLRAYEMCGWDLSESSNAISVGMFPTFKDLECALQEVIQSSAYAEELKSNYEGALLTRVKSLSSGLNGQIFCADEVDNDILFDSNVIVDLSRVGSSETKSLMMGLLIMRLNEHRMTFADGMNLSLKHVTVLEEAHHILKRTSTEQSAEGSNLAGKSVEMLSNSIAEMRTYGEAFIIVDQSPHALDMSAIRNTNTKIILRLPDEADRELAGKSAALKDEQLDEIAKLPKGVAVVYQNDWLEPVLCKISKFEGKESLYKKSAEITTAKVQRQFQDELIKLLLKGRVGENITIDLPLLEASLQKSQLSTHQKIKILLLLEEYKSTGILALWKTENFGELSELICDLFDSKMKISMAIQTFTNFEQLHNSFRKIIEESGLELSEPVYFQLYHAFLRHHAEYKEENLERYGKWISYMEEAKGAYSA